MIQFTYMLASAAILSNKWTNGRDFSVRVNLLQHLEDEGGKSLLRLPFPLLLACSGPLWHWKWPTALVCKKNAPHRRSLLWGGLASLGMSTSSTKTNLPNPSFISLKRSVIKLCSLVVFDCSQDAKPRFEKLMSVLASPV